MNNYFIKEGYRCNLDLQRDPVPYLDDESSSSLYQVKVYEFAESLIKNLNLSSVLDIGCGFAEKLKRIIYPVCSDIVGIDTKHSIDYCKQKHNFGQWYEDDIENPNLKLNKKFDLIISSDVIEHLVDPDRLLAYIKKHCYDNTNIIISTPERALIGGKDSAAGPPLNITHVREWDRSELRKYISSRGFKIIKHFLVGESGQSLFQIIRKLILFEPLKKIQVVQCKLEP